MKSPHLWLAAALIAGSLCSNVRAEEPSTHGSLETEAGHHAGSVRPLRWFRPARDVETVFRAQSDDGAPIPPDAIVAPADTVDLPPETTTEVVGDGVLGMPEPSTWNAFSPPITTDPFLDGGVAQPYAPAAPGYPGPGYGPPGYGAPGFGPGMGPGGYAAPGANCGRPYPFGWSQSLDLSLLPSADVNGGATPSSYEEFGIDYALTYTRPCSYPGWVLRESGLFRSRTWDGPAGGGPGLPGSAFRLGMDFEASTPQAGGHSVTLGITPSVNSDFNSSASSRAFQLDGRGIIWWPVGPGWQMGLGAMFWDRVDDRVIPYAGFVYRDDFWEVRLMFPESEIRLFLGNEPWWAKWVYVRARYQVEAYEIDTAGGIRDEVEFEDYEITVGFQMDAGYYRWFLEGGLVIDRDINYRINPDLTVDTSFITRLGWRY